MLPRNRKIPESQKVEIPEYWEPCRLVLVLIRLVKSVESFPFHFEIQCTHFLGKTRLSVSCLSIVTFLSRRFSPLRCALCLYPTFQSSKAENIYFSSSVQINCSSSRINFSGSRTNCSALYSLQNSFENMNFCVSRIRNITASMAVTVKARASCEGGRSSKPRQAVANDAP